MELEMKGSKGGAKSDLSRRPPIRDSHLVSLYCGVVRHGEGDRKQNRGLSYQMYPANSDSRRRVAERELSAKENGEIWSLLFGQIRYGSPYWEAFASS